MKNTYLKFFKRNILSLGLASLAFTACKKDSNNTVNIPAGITANFAGSAWKAVDATITGNISDGRVSIDAAASDGSLINIWIEPGTKVGMDDKLKNTNIWWQKSDGKTMYTTTPQLGGHGSFVLTTWDSAGKRVAGTFSGVMYNSYVANDSIVVSGGQFNCTYKVAD